MNEELKNKLREDFPLAFKRNPEIGVPDGWYEIIRTLAGLLEFRYDNLSKSIAYTKQRIAKGQTSEYCNEETLAKDEKRLEELREGAPHILQLKVKWFRATFYVDGGKEDSDSYRAMAVALECLADKTCGNCAKVQSPSTITRNREDFCIYCVDNLKKEA